MQDYDPEGTNDNNEDKVDVASLLHLDILAKNADNWSDNNRHEPVSSINGHRSNEECHSPAEFEWNY